MKNAVAWICRELFDEDAESSNDDFISSEIFTAIDPQRQNDRSVYRLNGRLYECAVYTNRAWIGLVGSVIEHHNS